MGDVASGLGQSARWAWQTAVFNLYWKRKKSDRSAALTTKSFFCGWLFLQRFFRRADNNAFQIFKALHFQVLWFALCRCSDISVIKLDSSRKHILIISFFHCIVNPLECKPSGFVWKPENLWDVAGWWASFIVWKKLNYPQPDCQFQMWPVHYCSACYRALMFAVFALVLSFWFQIIILRAFAFAALETFGITHFEQFFSALILGIVFFLKFDYAHLWLVLLVMHDFSSFPFFILPL